MLEAREVVPYLLRRELISPQVIVDDSLVIEQVWRRNRSFRILAKGGLALLMKQGIRGAGLGSTANEAAVYRLLESNCESNRLSESYAPHFVDFDPEENILTLELVLNSRDLRDYYSSSKVRFAAALGSALGCTLGAVHRSGITLGRRKEVAILQCPPPWVLSIHRPDANVLHEFSPAMLQLISIIQGSTRLCKHLDDLRESWQPTAFVHGDLRADNILRLQASSSRRCPKIKLVDWELAGIGDVSWDIGSIFSEYLAMWIVSMPIAEAMQPDETMRLADCPLDTLQPTVRAFWQAYVERGELGTADSYGLLIRSVQWCAARLLQTAFERMRFAFEVTGNMICGLQLADNILDRPQEAIVHLLGIGL
jgi:hypothetical protein